MRAVILQPMYLPWAGYFGLVEQADVFVFYDDVQFTRRSWQRRNKIKVANGEETWLTVPVEKDFGQEIRAVSVKDDGWRSDHWKSIHHSYANAPFFDQYGEELSELYDRQWESLLDLDTEIIDWLVETLGIDRPEFEYSSNLNAPGSKTERLINVLETVGADEYVSGPAAKDYLNPELFREHGIDLYWHEFDHPEYEQVHGDFISHLSCVDMLFHCGEDTRELIREAEQDALVPEF